MTGLVFDPAITEITAPTLVPEIRLHLACDAIPLWRDSLTQLEEGGLYDPAAPPEPFWAFAWAGGQALARYLLDHPIEVRDRRVLDVASGSGLVAIAAARAGARRVRAVDRDPEACAAIAANAALNHVEIEIVEDDPLGRPTRDVDTILVGDACYEEPLATRVTDWLSREIASGRRCLIGDPGRPYLPKHCLRALASYSGKPANRLEDSDLRNTTVWQFATSLPSP